MIVQILDNPNDRNIIEAIPYADAAARIDMWSGRRIGGYILGACRKNRARTGRGSAYVSANRDSPWAMAYGRGGFIAEVVTDA